LKQLNGWYLTHDGERIRKDWKVQRLMTGIALLQSLRRDSEAEDHQSGFAYEEYRNVWIELSTHAIGGLSENDFISGGEDRSIAGQLKKQ